jgi:ferredoxin
VAIRLIVNPAVCDGFGYCAEILPEYVSLDEWGFPVLSSRVVPERLLRAAAQAARACPRGALVLQAVDEAGLRRGPQPSS